MLVLVVDDSRAMRMIVLSHLRKAGFSSHEFIEAENGKIALDLVLSKEPDVILSDWNMPEMTGIQLLTELDRLVKEKKLDKLPKFVFVTSESTFEMISQAENLGAKGFITKPFTVEIFEAKLEKIIV